MLEFERLNREDSNQKKMLSFKKFQVAISAEIKSENN